MSPQVAAGRPAMIALVPTGQLTLDSLKPRMRVEVSVLGKWEAGEVIKVRAKDGAVIVRLQDGLEGTTTIESLRANRADRPEAV